MALVVWKKSSLLVFLPSFSVFQNDLRLSEERCAVLDTLHADLKKVHADLAGEMETKEQTISFLSLEKDEYATLVAELREKHAAVLASAKQLELDKFDAKREIDSLRTKMADLETRKSQVRTFSPKTSVESPDLRGHTDAGTRGRAGTIGGTARRPSGRSEIGQEPTESAAARAGPAPRLPRKGIASPAHPTAGRNGPSRIADSSTQ